MASDKVRIAELNLLLDKTQASLAAAEGREAALRGALGEWLAARIAVLRFQESIAGDPSPLPDPALVQRIHDRHELAGRALHTAALNLTPATEPRTP